MITEDLVAKVRILHRGRLISLKASLSARVGLADYVTLFHYHPWNRSMELVLWNGKLVEVVDEY